MGSALVAVVAVVSRQQRLCPTEGRGKRREKREERREKREERWKRGEGRGERGERREERGERREKREERGEPDSVLMVDPLFVMREGQYVLTPGN